MGYSPWNSWDLQHTSLHPFCYAMLSHFSRVRLCVTPRLQPTRLPHPWDSPGKNTGVDCHFLLQRMKVKRESEVAQSCLTLSDPMDCRLPGSSVHGIFQARVLEWGAIAFSDILFGWVQKQSSLYFCTSSGIFTAIIIPQKSSGGEWGQLSPLPFKRRKQLHPRRIKGFAQGCWVSPGQNQPKNWVSWLSELYLCSTYIWPKSNESCGFVFWLLVWGNREIGLGNAPPAGICGLVTDIQR